MKSRKITILIMLLGLLLVAFAAGIAQTPSQGDQKNKSETCCSMDSCCCKDGSCPMKEDGTAATDAKDGCCGSGESCDMKMKHDMKAHGKKSDCCNIKNKDKNKVKQKAA